MGKDKEQHGWMEMFIDMMKDNTARADAQMKAQTELIKQTLEKQGDKSGLRDGIKTLKELKELSDAVSPQVEVGEYLPPDQRPPTSWLDKIGGVIEKVLDRLEASGKLNPVNKNPAEEAESPEQQKERLIEEMAPEITAMVEAQVAERMKALKLEPPNQATGSTGPKAPELSEREKVSETFKIMLTEIETRAIPRKWVEHARDNWPKKILDELSAATDVNKLMQAFQGYAESAVDKDILAKISEEVKDPAKGEWLGVGINALWSLLKEQGEKK